MATRSKEKTAARRESENHEERRGGRPMVVPTEGRREDVRAIRESPLRKRRDAGDEGQGSSYSLSRFCREKR